MTELEQLINEIEELRAKMIKVKEVKKVYSDPEVVAVSQELDILLNRYQEILLKISTDDPSK